MICLQYRTQRLYTTNRCLWAKAGCVGSWSRFSTMRYVNVACTNYTKSLRTSTTFETCIGVESKRGGRDLTRSGLNIYLPHPCRACYLNIHLSYFLRAHSFDLSQCRLQSARRPRCISHRLLCLHALLLLLLLRHWHQVFCMYPLTY